MTSNRIAGDANVLRALLGQPRAVVEQRTRTYPNQTFDSGLGMTLLHAQLDEQRLGLLLFADHVAQILAHERVLTDEKQWAQLLAHRDALLGAPAPIEDDLTAFERAAYDLLTDPYQRHMYGGAVFGVAAQPLDSYLAFALLSSNGRTATMRAMLRSLNLVARVSAASWLLHRTPLAEADRTAIDVIASDPAPFGWACGGCIVIQGTAQEVLFPAPPAPRRERWWQKFTHTVR